MKEKGFFNGGFLDGEHFLSNRSNQQHINPTLTTFQTDNRSVIVEDTVVGMLEGQEMRGRSLVNLAGDIVPWNTNSVVSHDGNTRVEWTAGQSGELARIPIANNTMFVVGRTYTFFVYTVGMDDDERMFITDASSSAMFNVNNIVHGSGLHKFTAIPSNTAGTWNRVFRIIPPTHHTLRNDGHLYIAVVEGDHMDSDIDPRIFTPNQIHSVGTDVSQIEVSTTSGPFNQSHLYVPDVEVEDDEGNKSVKDAVVQTRRALEYQDDDGVWKPVPELRSVGNVYDEVNDHEYIVRTRFVDWENDILSGNTVHSTPENNRWLIGPIYWLRHLNLVGAVVSFAMSNQLPQFNRTQAHPDGVGVSLTSANDARIRISIPVSWGSTIAQVRQRLIQEGLQVLMPHPEPKSYPIRNWQLPTHNGQTKVESHTGAITPRKQFRIWLDTEREYREGVLYPIESNSRWLTTTQTRGGSIEDLQLLGQTRVNLGNWTAVDSVPVGDGWFRQNTGNWIAIYMDNNSIASLVQGRTYTKLIQIYGMVEGNLFRPTGANNGLGSVDSDRAISSDGFYKQALIFNPHNINNPTIQMSVIPSTPIVGSVFFRVAIFEGNLTDLPDHELIQLLDIPPQTLHSVGTDVPAMTVHSISENLFDGQSEAGSIDNLTGLNVDPEIEPFADTHLRSVNYIPVHGNQTVVVDREAFPVHWIEFDRHKNYIRSSNVPTMQMKLQPQTRYVKFWRSITGFPKGIMLGPRKDVSGHNSQEFELRYMNEDGNWVPIPELRCVGEIRDEIANGEYIVRTQMVDIQNAHIDMHVEARVARIDDRSIDTIYVPGRIPACNILPVFNQNQAGLLVNNGVGVRMATNASSAPYRIFVAPGGSGWTVANFRQWASDHNLEVLVPINERRYPVQRFPLNSHHSTTHVFTNTGALQPSHTSFLIRRAPQVEFPDRRIVSIDSRDRVISVPDTVEGTLSNLRIEGETYVNLTVANVEELSGGNARARDAIMEQRINLNGSEIIIDVTNVGWHDIDFPSHILRPNTRYTIIILPLTDNIQIIHIGSLPCAFQHPTIPGENIDVNQLHKSTAVTRSSFDRVRYAINATTGQTRIKIGIFEGDITHLPEEQLRRLLDAKPREFINVGSEGGIVVESRQTINLFDGLLERGTWDAGANPVTTNFGARAVNLIRVEGGRRIFGWVEHDTHIQQNTHAIAVIEFDRHMNNLTNNHIQVVTAAGLVLNQNTHWLWIRTANTGGNIVPLDTNVVVSYNRRFEEPIPYNEQPHSTHTIEFLDDDDVWKPVPELRRIVNPYNQLNVYDEIVNNEYIQRTYHTRPGEYFQPSNFGGDHRPTVVRGRVNHRVTPWDSSLDIRTIFPNRLPRSIHTYLNSQTYGSTLASNRITVRIPETSPMTSSNDFLNHMNDPDNNFQFLVPLAEPIHRPIRYNSTLIPSHNFATHIHMNTGLVTPRTQFDILVDPTQPFQDFKEQTEETLEGEYTEKL